MNTTDEPGWRKPFRVTSGEIELYRHDDETVDLVFHQKENPDISLVEVIPGLTRQDLTNLGGRLIRHGTHAVTQVPLTWADGELLSAEERLRIALLRMAGCTCRLPLLGYTGGKRSDGPRCRLCNTGIVFENTPTEG